MLQVLLPLGEALRPRRDDEAGLAAALQVGFDGGDDDVDVGDAAVRDPRLRAVEHPLVRRRVVHGARAQRGDVGAGVGLADAERTELDVARRAVALGYPLHDLLGRAVAGDPGGGEAGAHDRHADAGVAPEQLLDGDRQRQPGRIAHRVHQEVDAVEADLGGLGDDGPGELLALVPLVGGGADDAFGEVVHPLLDLQLVLVECEGEGHGLKLPPGNHTVYRRVTTRRQREPSSRPGPFGRDQEDGSGWDGGCGARMPANRQRVRLAAPPALLAAVFSCVAPAVDSSPPVLSRWARTNQWNSSS